MSADVVIVTWRSGARILSCLRHLASQQPAERTFVVDNASGDDSVAGVRRDFPAVQLLELPENVGFGRGVNAGAAAGDSEAIILVNDDVEVDSGFVREILAPLEEDERCAMVAGMTLLPDRERVDAFGIELDVTLAAYNRLRNRLPDEQPGHLAMPSGGAAAYRRSAFEHVGGFDSRLFAYGEDVDLGLRLLLAGWTAREAAGAHGVHLGGASIGVGSPRQRELSGFARGFLLARYGVLRTHAAARALFFEALVVGWGLARHRTLAPFTARIRGYRAGRAECLPLPQGVLDTRIGSRSALARLREG